MLMGLYKVPAVVNRGAERRGNLGFSGTYNRVKFSYGSVRGVAGNRYPYRVYFLATNRSQECRMCCQLSTLPYVFPNNNLLEPGQHGAYWFGQSAVLIRVKSSRVVLKIF